MNDHETTVAAMKEFVQDFVDERDWQQVHDPENLSTSMAIEATCKFRGRQVPGT